MGIIWEKADYLIRLLFIIVLGIACILIVIAPLYGARNNPAGIWVGRRNRRTA